MSIFLNYAIETAVRIARIDPIDGLRLVERPVEIPMARIGFQPNQQSRAYARSSASFRSGVLSPSRPLVSWFALIGVLLPFYLAIYVGGARFPPGRIIFFFLLIPALVTLFSGGRRAVLSDAFAIAAAAWMVFATSYSGSAAGTTSAIAQALEFLSAYLTGRAFFLERPAVESFVKALRIVTIAIVALALVDTASGQFMIHNTVAGFMNVEPLSPQYRNGIVRATATLDHPILLGCFCAFAAAIFLYAERSAVLRIIFVGIALLGCLLTLSSAPFQGFAVVLGAYAYDRILARFPLRWVVLIAGLGGVLLLAFLLTNNPVGWVIRNLTLDPFTGYWRVMIWEIATAQIAKFPITGLFEPFNNEILDSTVDSVWLVVSLRYGIPMAALLFLVNISTFWSNGKRKVRNSDPYMNQLRTGFTLVLATFMFLGFTVHFWNYMWLFWSLCIGIRASLREQSFHRFRARAAKQSTLHARLDRPTSMI